MKINADFKLNLKTKEATEQVMRASKEGLKDLVVSIAGDTIQGSPQDTGNNMRSIMYEVGHGGEVAQGDLEGAVYSTSGYGGYLETGTIKMPARPYFRPALDKNAKNLPSNIKGHLG